MSRCGNDESKFSNTRKSLVRSCQGLNPTMLNTKKWRYYHVFTTRRSSLDETHGCVGKAKKMKVML